MSIAFIQTRTANKNIWINVNEMLSFWPHPPKQTYIQLTDGSIILADEDVTAILKSIKEVIS